MAGPTRKRDVMQEGAAQHIAETPQPTPDRDTTEGQPTPDRPLQDPGPTPARNVRISDYDWQRLRARAARPDDQKIVRNLAEKL